MSALVPRLHPSERRDALRYVGEAEAVVFVERQRAARLRATLMNAFYLRYPSRMGVLHRLAASGIALTRFAAVSEAYHVIGDLLCPVDAELRPRTARWEAYVEAFEEGRPADYREECWLRAHLADMEAVKAEGWTQRFTDERDAHRGDPMWDQLHEHMEVTLGTRLHDRAALAGEIALETAIASSLRRVTRRQLVTGLGLVRVYVAAAAIAMVRGGPWVPPHLPSDRQLVGSLVRATAQLTRVWRVWRLGHRRRAWGAEGKGAAWSLQPSLQAVLGDDLHTVDPTVLRMFDAMHDFRMTASVHLHHHLGRWLAWWVTLLLGQGMFEEELEQVPARFRLFRRDDGSLHFVREFWCDESVRRFDSDFVVRDVDGRPTLLEVFVDLGVAARMRTEVLDDGGLSMTVVGLFVRGLPVGLGPAQVRFETRPAGPDRLEVVGMLDVRPRTRLGRWLWHRVVGLPERLGEIRYFAVPAASDSDPGSA